MGLVKSQNNYLNVFLSMYVPSTQLRPLTHTNQDTPSPHHRSPKPPQSTHGLLEDNHPQQGRHQEIGRGIGDGDFRRGGTGCQGAGEQGPHYDVTEDVEAEAELCTSRSVYDVREF